MFPYEPVKTVLSFLFLTFGFLVSSFSLALTHDRVPDYDPLPDIVLDNTTYHQWGLKVCEIIIIISILLAFLTVLLHTHRMIVIRRVFLILGLLYMYRGLTMFVTVLPIPDKNYKCAPQLKHTITFFELISRVVTILTEGGLSLTGNKFYCGDFIFSGHTMILMMTFFVVRECEYSGEIDHFKQFPYSRLSSYQEVSCPPPVLLPAVRDGCGHAAGVQGPLLNRLPGGLLGDQQGLVDLPHHGQQQQPQDVRQP